MDRSAAITPLPQAAPPELAVWEFAGLMTTYWCNAKCAFCYVYSGPDRGGEMRVDQAVALWRGLDRLAAKHGKTMRIHLAGGEPTGDWTLLVAILRAARDAGLTRLEKIETNAAWATDDDLVRARIELLDALGIEKLQISADVYHQEFVPFERVERCVRIGRQVLGRGRIRVRWWEFLQRPVIAARKSPQEKEAAFQAALNKHKDRLTGRAALRLARFFERHPAAHFAGECCVEEVLHSKHVHVDPYGNVFPGVCSGIILGNAAEREIDALWRELKDGWEAHPVVSAVVNGGSYELMGRAKEFGYEELPDGYANKCHLCTDVRQFLSDRGIWPEFVGPRECYANETDQREAAGAKGVSLALLGGAT